MAKEKSSDYTPEEKLLFALFGREPKPEEPMTPERQARIEANEARLRVKIDGVLSALDADERKVIEMRYGLGDGYVYTVEEVSAELRKTPALVRRLEESAIRKLGDFRVPQVAL